MSGLPKEEQEDEKKPALLQSHINFLNSRKRKSAVTNREEDKKIIEPLPHISIKVKGQDGNEASFRIRKSTQLLKVMNAYCEEKSLERGSIAFLFDGRRVRWDQIPDELGMEDGDEIDAMLHQSGGTIIA